MGSEARSQDFFGQFRGLFKEIGAKRGGRAPPAPPSVSAPDCDMTKSGHGKCGVRAVYETLAYSAVQSQQSVTHYGCKVTAS